MTERVRTAHHQFYDMGQSIMLDQDNPRITGSRSRNRTLDFRSDTVTQPDAGMRRAMAEAEVGDDVYGDDPSVNRLEEEFAAMFGKDAAVFFPTGTQSNLSAILTHCGRGDEILVGRSYHTYAFEAGGASVLGGISYCPLTTRDDGCIELDEIDSSVKADDPHFPRTRLLCLENTVSGRAIPLASMEAASQRARKYGLKVHLDGARLFNAAVQLGIAVDQLAAVADTVSVCLSKGLGTPAGTLLACSKGNEPAVRRNRKILGGGMRQSGVLAAAGLYALNANVGKLREDHRRARMLANLLDAFSDRSEARVSQATNMVLFEPRPADHAPLREFLLARGFLVTSKAPVMRFVLHLGLNDEDTTCFAQAIEAYFAR